jgi:hypothetical protein
MKISAVPMLDNEGNIRLILASQKIRLCYTQGTQEAMVPPGVYEGNFVPAESIFVQVV